MKLLKKLTAATAVALAMAANANASVVMNDWVFNPVGTGFASGQVINEYLDVNGNAFIQLTPTGGSGFNFVEHAAFNIVQADSNAQLFPVNYPGGNITATFEAYGTGNFSGAFTFGGGTIRMYQNPVGGQYTTTAGMYGADLGNMIAEFTVLAGGGGNVDGTGNPTGNGDITVWATATTPGGMDPGYFFRGNGDDLSAEDVLAFAFTNANAVGQVTPNMVSEIACQYAGYTGPGCPAGTYQNVSGDHFFVSNNGQFKLTQVPEPGSLALFGIALLGAGVVSRKRAANKA
jgi:hypothetical protein